MSSQSLTERREDEIQAVLAIFTEDAKDLRENDAWKVSRPPEIKVTLRPQESMGETNQAAYVHVDLIVKCSDMYPDDPPDLKLENPKGLSNQQLATLKEDLITMSQTLIGEVMILELASHVQTFLHANNKPPTMSFYEEMMSAKKKQEEMVAQEQMRKMELQRKKEERERKHIEDEILRMQAALKTETKKMKEEENNWNGNNSPTSEPTTPSSDAPGCSPIAPLSPVISRSEARSSESPISSREHLPLLNGISRRQRRTSTPKRTTEEIDNRSRPQPGGVIVLAFNTKGERTVQRGMCIDHCSNGSTLYAGMDTSSGALVTICEWVLKWRHFANKKSHLNIEEDKEANLYMKQIHSIEQELFSLIRIRHPNLLSYFAMRYQKDPGKITIHILMEHAGSSTLDSYLKRSLPVPMELLRCYTDEMLQAVEHLHNKAVVHKDLRASSVFIDYMGKIKLADYSINKRLSDLYETIEQARPGVRFQDVRPSVIGKGGKKADIFQLGQLILSLVEGDRITDIQPVIPTTLPPQLHDFITKCLMHDERHRWSASQLLDHAFLKEPLHGTIHIKSPDHDQHHKEQEQMEKKKAEDDDEDEGLPYTHVTALEATGLSRLTAEFTILKSLGKGGFGEVIKVKNKLDGRMYAIKRIPLNPKSKQFNKKITREVKLLSRLNHENVVRYYNSWIEVSEEPAESDSSSTYTPTNKTPSDSDSKKSPKKSDKNSLDEIDDIERDAPQAVDSSVEWSISIAFDAACQKALASDSDDDDEDENDVFGKSFLPIIDNSESVVFETGPTEEDQVDTDLEVDGRIIPTKTDTNTNTEDIFPEIVPKLQYLYIQMEYCEKSTLRNCIDAGLYQDVTRVWRLFREIVEGLIHIHEQGMIHRDLKPVNIFLDSNDHVKIGDFGLATTDIAKSGILDASLPALAYSDLNILSSSRSGSLGDGILTGKVGTALYVSPEVMCGGTKLHYDQKVDIYSLGIIFFEMCYRPLPTGMERVQTLSSLRSDAIAMPDDFDLIEMGNQAQVIKWLLSHDPSQRPTSKEILQSDYLPPPQMEEAELNEILRSTIANPQSKSYRRMLDAVFGQRVSPATDISYDLDSKGLFSLRSCQLTTQVYETLERVFQLHGAIKMSTPFLMPQSDIYKDIDQFVRLMDHSGGLVGLPYDLRVPFARYIARSGIYFMKRYSVDRVFREKKFFGLHPREMTECAFDIVTPTQGSLIPDAEILILVQHCIAEFSPLQKRNYCIRMNHQSLLKAVLLHCGIPEEKHRSVLTVLASAQFNKEKRAKALESLVDVSLTEQSIATLTSLLDIKGAYNTVASILRIITKTRGQASTLAKQGLHEIEAVITHANSMGLTLQVVVTVGLIYNHLLYSGVIFQVMREVKKKKQNAIEVIAAGGRYDKMIRQLISPLHPLTHAPTAVGVSFGFDRIVAALWETMESPAPYDILVYTVGFKPMIKERLAIVKELWATGLKTEVLYETKQTLQEISDYCRTMGVSHLVVLKDTETSSVKVKSFEKDKVMDKKVPIAELADFLQQKMIPRTYNKGDSADWGDNNPCYEKKASSGPSTNYPDSYTDSSRNVSNPAPTYNVIFNMLEGRISSNTKRKYEAQIFAKVTAALPWLPGRSHDILAFELPKAVLSIMAAYLELNGSEAEFDASIGAVIEKQPRHRKYLTHIIDDIHDLKFEKRCQFIILYSLKDDSIKVLS